MEAEESEERLRDMREEDQEWEKKKKSNLYML